MADELFYGRVVDMVRVSDGATFAVAGGIADTVLHLSDTSDFDELGGQVQIGADVYDYDAVDYDADTITLTTGLLVAWEVDDLVEVLDPELGTVVVEYVAHVLLEDQDPGDAPIEVTVQHALVDLLSEAIRGGVAEAVTLMRDGPDDFLIFQVEGKLAVDIALAQTQTQLDSVQVDLDELNNVTLPQVQSDLANAQSDISGLQGQFPITSTNISDSAITTPKLAANSVTGDKIIGNTIVGAHIVGLTITGDKIAGNTISGDKIIANSITADKLSANAIDGKTITGATLQTAAPGSNRITIRNSGGIGYLEGWTGSAAQVSPGGVYMQQVSGSTRTVITSGAPSGYGSAELWITSDSSSVGAIGVYTSAPFTCENQVLLGGPLGNNVTTVTGKLDCWAAVHGNTLWSDVDSGAASSSGADMGPDGKIKRSTSSRRYKTDIVDATFDFDTLMAMRPVTYRRLDEPDTPRVGLIAEEVAALGLTSFITYDAEDRIDGVRYADLVAPLIAWARDHENRLRTLEGAAA